MRQIYSVLGKRLLLVCFVFILFIIVATGNGTKKIITYNSNKVKSVEAMHIVNKYNNLSNSLVSKVVSNMSEVSIFGASTPVKFYGQMTGYGPDCVGCSGILACPPRQDVRGGNIFFDDSTYGRVRILAADSAIPCGSIIKVSGVTFSSQPIFGIVLDRGSAIKGNIIDFLVESTSYAGSNIGRQSNIGFDIIRWGW